MTAHSIGAVSAKVKTAATVPGPCPVTLDGDGVETTAMAAGPYFDHDGDGFAERTGWVGKDDGLVLWDRDGSGSIDSGCELFGNHTRLAGGSEAPGGFAALAVLDADGVLDARDAAFATLRIWRDADGDGVSAPAELQTFAEAGVRSIATSPTDSTLVDAQGNAHRQIGTFTRADGSQGAAADVWCQADRLHTLATQWVALPARIAALPDASGSGTVRGLHAEEMAGYWEFRDRFAGRDAELGWAMDSAGRIAVNGSAAADVLAGTIDADALRGDDGADSLSGVLDSEFKRARLGELTEWESRALQRLVSPVDGVVQQLAVHTVRGVVTPGQQLMVVVPQDASLEGVASPTLAPAGAAPARAAAAPDGSAGRRAASRRLPRPRPERG